MTLAERRPPARKSKQWSVNAAMRFEQAIEHVFANYAVFSGRARRSEFWYFQLFHYLVLTGLSLLAFTGIFALLWPVYALGTLIPRVAVCWRRLHDVGKSGAWYFIGFVPVVGTILLIVWLAGDSEPGANQYGPNPKGAPAPYSPAPAQPAPARGNLAVQCIAGPLQGQSYRMGGRLMFGRRPDCAIRLPDGTPGVSGYHCSLEWRQGVPVLIDLGSRYGTFLADGKQLPPNYPEAVAAGTRFYLGNTGNLFQITVF